jgi:hypothetical protein
LTARNEIEPIDRGLLEPIDRGLLIKNRFTVCHCDDGDG